MLGAMRTLLVLLLLATTATADPSRAPAQQQLVTVTAKTIEVTQPIYFELSKPTIKQESYPVLDAVVAALKANPKVGLVEIQGHTDERGNDAYNLKVSEERAHAIYDYLVGKGIDAKRLRAKGYGETKPLDPAHTEKAWAKNRRIAFVILQRN
jgi:outer membrane protein OmpA-like peptidoglycan-associated protein